MGFWAIAGLVAGSFAICLVLLVIWGTGFSDRAEARRGPQPHQPARLVAHGLDLWYESPRPLESGGCGSTAGVEVAVLVRVGGGEFSDDEGSNRASLLVEFADGELVSLEQHDLSPARYLPATSFRCVAKRRNSRVT